MNPNFTAWAYWRDRTELPGLSYPGVYALAITQDDLSRRPFLWMSEIVYIGMTNSKGGLKSRLGQFENTIKGGAGHSGAHRVRFNHPDYTKLITTLYVAVCVFPCDVTSNDPSDLRVMGDVAKHEYECFATFREKFGVLPQFNDKTRSPKK